jgi:hypothetical protein
MYVVQQPTTNRKAVRMSQSQSGATGATTVPAAPKAKATKSVAKAAVPLHPNPRIAKALAENARNGDKYASAAALARAVGITDMPTQRALRQVLRDAGMGVGRGRRYADITAPKVVKAAQSNAKRAKGGAKAEGSAE